MLAVQFGYMFRVSVCASLHPPVACAHPFQPLVPAAPPECSTPLSGRALAACVTSLHSCFGWSVPHKSLGYCVHASCP